MTNLSLMFKNEKFKAVAKDVAEDAWYLLTDFAGCVYFALGGIIFYASELVDADGEIVATLIIDNFLKFLVFVIGLRLAVFIWSTAVEFIENKFSQTTKGA